MRLWIFSDLHRDVGRPWTPPAIPAADVAVVAGDLGGSLVDGIAWLAQAVRPHMPVVLAAGNCDFHGTCHPEELRRGRAAALDLGIDLLENRSVVIGGVAFSGCTLWTDYDLEGERWRADAMREAADGLNDHRLIASRREQPRQPFRPDHAAELHRESRAFLQAILGAGPVEARSRVVVSHHAPSGRSVARRYLGRPMNPSYASRLDSLVAAAAPGVWIHGHTHTSFDYRCGDTRVLCNPKGYGAENPDFDPAMLVDVPSKES
jgi:hypothetical protein